MNIGSICQRKVITVRPSLELRGAAELMREQHVGFLIVLPAELRAARVPVGVLTDRDIVVSVIAKKEIENLSGAVRNERQIEGVLRN